MFSKKSLNDKNGSLHQDLSSHFIREIIERDLATGKVATVKTRFPPEPNGYLHIGHAKSICLNFGLAQQYHGTCNLRFDDTNPSKEEIEYVESIQKDVHWLGFDWQDRMYYASDYFEEMYQYACTLIKKGLAYVCSLTPDEVREYRGTLTEPGKSSPFRDRPVQENLDLFERMRAGEFQEGTHVLRAKIDMASPNLNMRDPVIYRIRHQIHHRTNTSWCIYPMYDFAHCISDALEGITHSLCTMEFEDHRPLYDWFLNNLDVPCHPQQIEFARLNIGYTVLSKRKLTVLVEKGYAQGWDDPRMPTLAGMRRRGYPPEAIRNFCERISVGKVQSLVDRNLLDYFAREYLNKTALRVMAVLHPLRVVIDNYPEGKQEDLEAINNPEDESCGTRKVTFTRVIYIEREDFQENPPKKYFRLAPGCEVRLKHAYYITCQKVVKDPTSGEIIEVHCLYDPASRGGWTPDGRKVKGTLHWVSSSHAVNAQVRLYDNFFTKENLGALEEGEDFLNYINPDSCKVIDNCKVEESLSSAQVGVAYQFLRNGYFCLDSKDNEGQLVFNRIVPLRDSWAKIEYAQKKNL